VERKWKERYSQKFRRRAVARTNACENIVRLSRELGLTRSLLYKWRYRLEPPDAQVEGGVSTQNSRESRLRREVNKLKQFTNARLIVIAKDELVFESERGDRFLLGKSKGPNCSRMPDDQSITIAEAEFECLLPFRDAPGGASRSTESISGNLNDKGYSCP
jgi:transposase-like protein